MSTSATEAAHQDNTAGKAAWICLAIAWLTFLVPVPGIGLIFGWPLNLLAFILAVVAMSRLGASAGILPMLASLIMSPFIYFIGILIFAGAIHSAQPGDTSDKPKQTPTSELRTPEVRP